MWKVTIKPKVLKGLDKLPARVVEDFVVLHQDLINDGPEQSLWSNYSKLGTNRYHCHLSRRWVACWTADRETITLEVYYVGSRENAPY